MDFNKALFSFYITALWSVGPVLCWVLIAAMLTDPTPDQRAQQTALFFKCIDAAPSGPVQTQTREWAEVVIACRETAKQFAK